MNLRGRLRAPSFESLRDVVSQVGLSISPHYGFSWTATAFGGPARDAQCGGVLTQVSGLLARPDGELTENSELGCSAEGRHRRAHLVGSKASEWSLERIPTVSHRLTPFACTVRPTAEDPCDTACMTEGEVTTVRLRQNAGPFPLGRRPGSSFLSPPSTPANSVRLLVVEGGSTLDVVNDVVDRLTDLLRDCASHVGRAVPENFALSVQSRVSKAEAALILRGLDSGLLSVDGNYLRTLDPFQETSWLVEGHPVHPCWEYLPHAAAYVELIHDFGVSPNLVRFESPKPEFNLDLAVLESSGRVVLLGEAKARSKQLDNLLRDLAEHQGSDPGRPVPIAKGGPKGARRDAWKLAHQLWALRPPLLWLIAPDDRRAFAVGIELDRLSLTPIDALETQRRLPRQHDHVGTPRIVRFA